ncbi:MAG TPA: hypothetical protein VJX67_13265 [Blastocatellia bacterium]|nr:hypothetical protein [Blastocatellia bacterium]
MKSRSFGEPDGKLRRGAGIARQQWIESLRFDQLNGLNPTVWQLGFV